MREEESPTAALAKYQGKRSLFQTDEPPGVYINIKQLSRHLSIKTSTLYAWVGQHKIPFVKIHGLIRFRLNEIDRWLESFREEKHYAPPPPSRKTGHDIDTLIARAKCEVYTARRGKPDQDRAERKEKDDGSV
jgi:excisionase family DNA binding protein